MCQITSNCLPSLFIRLHKYVEIQTSGVVAAVIVNFVVSDKAFSSNRFSDMMLVVVFGMSGSAGGFEIVA